MRDITKLKKECIGANGVYIDLRLGDIYPLSPSEIAQLRIYYNDPTIAKDFEIKSRKVENAPKIPKVESNVSQTVRVKQQNRTNSVPTAKNVPTAKKKKKKYKLTRNQKYSKNVHNLNKVLQKHLCTILLIGGVSLSVVLGGSIYGMLNQDDVYLDRPNYGVSVTDSEIGIIITDEYNVSSYDEEIQNRKDIIKNICDIYQVNYDVVYEFLQNKTENFSREDYLDGYMDGVTCKGINVNAGSEEELLIYMIRVIKQDPARWGIDTTNLYINNGYQSSNTYCEQIKYVSDVLGVDKCLMYAIVQSECGFDSELFNEYNNPAGIMDDGGWWKFDTKLEGFLELGMEIIKYYNWINEPLNDLSPEVIAKIRDIHAPLSDNNGNWLPNVLDRLEFAQNNSEELFGSDTRQFSH